MRAGQIASRHYVTICCAVTYLASMSIGTLLFRPIGPQTINTQNVTIGADKTAMVEKLARERMNRDAGLYSTVQRDDSGDSHGSR